jgi:hypothetical protein
MVLKAFAVPGGMAAHGRTWTAFSRIVHQKFGGERNSLSAERELGSVCIRGRLRGLRFIW